MLYFFHGPETFLAHAEIKKIAQDFDQHEQVDFGDDDSTSSQLRIWPGQLLQSSLLTEKRLFVFQNLLQKAAFPREQVDWVRAFEATHYPVIVWEKAKLPKGENSLLTYLLKKARVQEFKALTTPSLRTWLAKRALDWQSYLTPTAVNELILLHGSNLQQLDSELQKLAIFAKARTISQEDVLRLCVSSLEEKVFAFTDAVSQKDLKAALKAFIYLCQKRLDENYLFSMLCRQFRLLSLAKENALKKEHPFVREKMLAQSKNWQLAELKRKYRELTEIDYQNKMGGDLTTQILLFLGNL